MKLSVLQGDLTSGLNMVSRFVSPRAQLPVLSNILFSAKKGKLRLAATNLEMGISLEIGAKVEKEGGITIPAKMVVELVSTMPTGRIEIEEKEGSLNFSAGAFSSSLAGIPASEFPTVPFQTEKTSFSLKKEILEEIAKKISFSASIDDARPNLTGVLLLFGEENLRAVATDGFRLSLKDFKSAKEPEKKKERLLVPAKLLDELSRILGKEEEIGVSFLDKEGQILFSSNSAVLTGRLLEGEFPDYERILPDKTKYRATAGKDDLLQAVKAAAVFAREAASILRITIGDSRLKVEAESQQYGKEEAVVDAKTEGGEIEVAFNYRYLLDFLNGADGSEITFSIDGPTTPGLFEDNKDSSYKHLIMPVRVQA